MYDASTNYLERDGGKLSMEHINRADGRTVFRTTFRHDRNSIILDGCHNSTVRRRERLQIKILYSTGRRCVCTYMNKEY